MEKRFVVFGALCFSVFVLFVWGMVLPKPLPEVVSESGPDDTYEVPSAHEETASVLVTNTATKTPRYTEPTTVPTPATSQVTSEATYLVTRVVDGDTIEVLMNGDKKTVRYIGVDTPETVHPTKGVECFGREASAHNKELVLGQSVRLEKDVSETDRYGRLLRFVYVGDMFVNLALVADGYAYASTFPPDVSQVELFRVAQEEARTGKRGLWGAACSGETTSTASVPQTTVVAAPDTMGGSCTIKGNISSSGEKIYHTPGCGSYSKTVINEDAGEAWFCTEEDARSAGWRKALNC